MRKCIKCGSEMKDNAIFCTECGERLEETLEMTSAEENREKNLQNIKEVIKSKKMIAAMIAVAVIAVIAIVYMVNIKNAIKISDYCEVSYSGGEGFGTANVKLNYEALEAAICEMEGHSLDSAGYWTIVDAVEGNNIEVSVSPNENLSNGDKIEVKVNVLNEKAIKGVKLVEGSESVKVEGLVKYREITDEDLFRDIEVIYTGYSPYLEVSVENNSKDPFIKDVSYNVENNGEIKNGDQIIIEASWAESDAETNQCVVSGTGKKEVKVEEQAKFLLSKEDVTEDVLEKIKQKLEEDYNASYENQALIEIKDICLVDATNTSYEVNYLYALMEVEPNRYGEGNMYYITYYDTTIRDGEVDLGRGYSNLMFNFSNDTSDYDAKVENAKANCKACYDLMD